MSFLIRSSGRRILPGLTLFCLIALPGIVDAKPSSDALVYLKNLSIEELLDTKVTSVSKRPESLFNAAAAVTVITSEDIRRTGARTVPEALRLVPGLQVGQIDSSRYAIGSRGFSDYFENKLLVLVDGRSMYTPLYSGVYWNSLDTIMEDIERIEVIRGPGATMWGANAVNGVINIITKNAQDTQGGMVSTIFGSHAKPVVSTRYGGTINEDVDYRLYAKGLRRGDFEDGAGADSHDAWESYRTGFRLDSTLREEDRLSLQAEVFDGEADVTTMTSGFLTPPFARVTESTEEFSGGHIQANYQRSLSSASSFEVSLSYDGYRRDFIMVEEQRDTLNLEFKHHVASREHHDFVWGGGVRWSGDETVEHDTVSFAPASRDITLWSAFLQDDIALVDDTFWITLGSKLEHNDFTGVEVQPSVRARYKPVENHLLWAAVSRAVRTPSRAEQDVRINFGAAPGPPLSQMRLSGNPDFDAEELVAYELGYRWQKEDELSFDVATFYNDYDDLRTEEMGAPFPEMVPAPPHLVIPLQFVNGLEGSSYGVEASTTWQPLPELKISLGYSWIDLDLHRKSSGFAGEIEQEQNFPRYQFQARGYYDITRYFSCNTELYWVDAYEARGVDAYLRYDLQVSWNPSESLEITVGGENLFDSSHREATVPTSGIVVSEIPRQYWLKAIYRF